jgi:hypothetical protein
MPLPNRSQSRLIGNYEYMLAEDFEKPVHINIAAWFTILCLL